MAGATQIVAKTLHLGKGLVRQLRLQFGGGEGQPAQTVYLISTRFSDRIKHQYFAVTKWDAKPKGTGLVWRQYPSAEATQNLKKMWVCDNPPEDDIMIENPQEA